LHSVFISYSRADRAAIGDILSNAEKCSLKPWIDTRKIPAGAAFDQSILDGLMRCQAFLLIMTPRSAKSEYVKDELHWALSNREGRVIPVMLKKCDPAAFHLRMSRIQYVDLTPRNKAGKGDLLRALRLIRDTPSEEQLPLHTRPIGKELEWLSLLLTFISRNHQKHLRNLLAPPNSKRQQYSGRRTARHELRDLCTWGLVSRRPKVKIGEIAADNHPFTLRDAVKLTETGKRLAPLIP
jgi:hypothetical protein